MNPLPHISHQLFVAAVARGQPHRATRNSRTVAWCEVAARASAIPLEVLDAAHPLPAGLTAASMLALTRNPSANGL